MTLAVFFARLWFERCCAAQLRKSSIEDQQLFRFNRCERQPHAHSGFGIDHDRVGLEGPLFTGDSQPPAPGR
jgi:hypothetical protein